MTDQLWGWLGSGLVWLALAIATSALAGYRNRSRWSWFWVSMFFGPLALALLFAWPVPQSVPAPLRPATSRPDRLLLVMSALLVVVLFSAALTALSVAGIVWGEPGAGIAAIIRGSALLASCALFFFVASIYNRARIGAPSSSDL